ncbi:hypothetical protein CDL15_Pgr025781 [Punica granatum]|uniref:Non-classical arabinogalactan protein 30 n=1 Tax=Punica granatum TaxID=22663 RepID=A0A218WCX5_PUNGR|nr:hypothetical protein CDL15_Pgr025781 [Punica granatum]
MANGIFLFLSAILFAALATGVHGYAPPAKTPVPETTIEVVVEAMVYCQSCKYQGTWSLSDAKPIASAKVSVICKNYHRHVTYYKVFETDPHGYFYGQLKGFKMAHPILDHPLHACSVKLVSSPLEDCNLLSNINYGMYGAKLRYEDKHLVRHGYEAVIYTAGPLAFRPSYCPPPMKDEESGTHE